MLEKTARVDETTTNYSIHVQDLCSTLVSVSILKPLFWIACSHEFDGLLLMPWFQTRNEYHHIVVIKGIKSYTSLVVVT